MPPIFTPIQFSEFDSYVRNLGFKPIQLPNTTEHVYGKIIAKNLCLRVFSSIVNNNARSCGEDALRVCLVFREEDGKILYLGKQKRVNRTQGWRKNLLSRIVKFTSQKIEYCSCGRPMLLRKNIKTGNEFWGCIGYSNKKCSGTKPKV